jgi:hypothetical protein
MSIQKIYNLIFLYEYKLMLKIHNRQIYIYIKPLPVDIYLALILPITRLLESKKLDKDWASQESDSPFKN